MFFWAKRSYYEITAFSQLVSVSNCVSSKMALCLKSYQKTGSLKVKKLIQPDISGKISFRKKTLKIPPKLYFTDVCLVSFKWCNMVFFYYSTKTAWLEKIWFSSYSPKYSWPIRLQVFLNLEISEAIWGIKFFFFLQVGRHLYRLSNNLDFGVNFFLVCLSMV